MKQIEDASASGKIACGTRAISERRGENNILESPRAPRETQVREKLWDESDDTVEVPACRAGGGGASGGAANKPPVQRRRRRSSLQVQL